MKNILISIAMLLLTAASASAQGRTLDVYRNGSVVYSQAVSEIDSVIFKTSSAAPSLSAPTGVSAALTNSNSAVLVTWTAVSGASSYEVYRSGNNASYTLLTSGVTTNSYTDYSPLSGANYYKVKAVSATQVSGFSKASAPVAYGSSVETGLYMGIVGFNQALTTKDIGLLNTSTKSAYSNFVTSLTSKNGTVLYYAVDNAIDKLEAASLPSDLTNVAVVTFTDGLDQGSHMLNGEYQASDEAYLAALRNRIRSAQIFGKSVNAYSIGIRENDVSDVERFKANLRNLAYSPIDPGNANANVYEVQDMEAVSAVFQEIANSLYNESRTSSLALKIPGQADGTEVRFTFDNVADAANSTMYIEGTFKFSDKSLQNVAYSGCSSGNGATAAGTVSDIFVTYTFENIMQASGEALPTNNIKQWKYVPATNSWQINSEFTPDGNTEIKVERKSAVIMLVLDCSASLGADFATMQTSAQNFITTMSGGGSTNPQPGSNTFVEPEMIYVQGGTFTMGSADVGYTNKTLSDFYIGKYEVTQGLWESVMGYSGATANGGTLSVAATIYPYEQPSSTYGIGANYPVYFVSQDDIVNTFIPRLNAITGKTYRLPNEAEWEYAARGGNQSSGYVYSGSNTIDDVAWWSGNSTSAHPVGTKMSNELGIYDMTGNALEWCSDWRSYVDFRSGVLRGGGWDDDAISCSVWNIFSARTDNNWFQDFGFRLVLVP